MTSSRCSVLLIFAGSIMLSTGIILGVILGHATEPNEQPTVGESEVSDLIQRLKPLIKNPNRAWYSNGIRLTFYGDDSVNLELEMPNGDRYSVRSSTLSGTVNGITAPADAIRSALQGWPTTKK